MIIPPHTVSTYWPVIFLSAIVLLLLVTLASLAFGAVPVSAEALFRLAMSDADIQTKVIVFDLRLPRALLAASVGALLAICGTVTQGLFRNPLADPTLIGVSAGASAGASLVIVFLHNLHWSMWGLSLVSVGAFVGSIITVLFVYRLATSANGTSVATMLLTGIAITYFAGSITNVLEFVADNEMLRRISLWRMGGLEAADYPRVAIMMTITLIILLLLPRHYRALNALLLGESEARHLGINVNYIKTLIIICVAAGVGTSVAMAGSITFIGLIVPHMVRLLIGPNHRYLIPISACVGAQLLVIADIFSRTILAPTELPVGLITSFIGVPIFISLLKHRHEYGMR